MLKTKYINKKLQLMISLVVCILFGFNSLALSLPQEKSKKINQKNIALKNTSPKAIVKLQDDISDLLKQPELASASLAIRVINQTDGQVIFEKDIDKLLKPASNMKLYTTAAALELLGKDYRIRTSVYGQTKPNSEGTIKGKLILYGRGDPTLASSYLDDTQPFDSLAKQLVNNGVKKIEGDLIADESYFRGSSLGQGWEWLDLQWQFGAEISALSSYDNKVDVQIKPGVKVGDPCQITISPDVGIVSLINHMETTQAKVQREIGLNRGLADNSLLAWGKMPVNDEGFSSKIAVHHPAELTANLFNEALKRAGIILTGKILFADASLRSTLAPSEPEKNSLLELAAVESPPLSEIIRILNKFSQNLYAELLLRTLGRLKGNPEKDSDEAGVEVVKDFLNKAGINTNKLAIYDGSGLSRKDLINVFSTTQLLQHISKSSSFEVFRASLPIAGVDGTLRRRMLSTSAYQNVRAKTGTLSNTSSLSGYVTSNSGEVFIFSIMIDNVTTDLRQALSLEDKICQLLASFSDKTNLKE